MNKAILITGAGARVGKALALGLAKDGWRVAVHYNRSKDGADAVVAEIERNGGYAESLQANLAIATEMDDLIARAAQAVDMPITALINNASTFTDDTAGDFTNAGFDHHMSVNLRAPLSLTQQLADHLGSGKTGCIINMIDQRVLKPNPTFFTYALSKSALHWATKTMAQEFAPRIRINGIGPGPTLQSTHQTQEEFAHEMGATLLKNGSPPAALLDAARYLLQAQSVTGQMLAVDGGQHLTWRTPDLMSGDTRDD